MAQKTNRIFKYHCIDENLYSSIITTELYFSNPQTFNDPFDSNPRFKTCSNKKQLKEFYTHLKSLVNKKSKEIKQISKFKSKKESMKTVIENVITVNNFAVYDANSQPSDERLVEIFIFYNHSKYFESLYKTDIIALQCKMFDDFIFLSIQIENYGIWSASQTSTCPVLWGHYADNHRGICLEFELLDEIGKSQINFDDNIPPFKIINVNYTKQPIDIFSMNTESLQEVTNTIINTKYDKWEYEKEVRLINSNQGLVKFNKLALKSVIFGHRSSGRYRYAICKLLAHLKYECNIYVARIQPDNYEMKIEPMVINDIIDSGIYLSELHGLETVFK